MGIFEGPNMANCLMERLIPENLVMRSPVPKPVEIAQLTAEYAKAKRAPLTDPGSHSKWRKPPSLGRVPVAR